MREFAVIQDALQNLFKGWWIKMGLFNDFVNQIAGILGESLRIRKARSKTKSMDAETKITFNKLVQMAENGNEKAMFELGQWYYKGQRIGYDPERVCYWWTKAAEKGDVVAQYNLGLMYHGKISPISFDQNKAGHWFAKAAQNGDADSKRMLDKWYEYNRRKGKWEQRFEPNNSNN